MGRDIIVLFESEEEDHYEPLRIGNALKNNYIVHGSSSDRNKTLSIEKYLNKIRPCLGSMINYYKKQGKWKIQSSIATNFLSSKDTNETCAVHSKSDNKEIKVERTFWFSFTEISKRLRRINEK